MADTALRERIDLFRARGGKRATAYWLLRRLARIDVYTLYAVPLHSPPLDASKASGFDFIVLRDPGDVGRHAPRLIETISEQCGCGVAETIRRGGRLYALARGDDVLSQLKIEIAGSSIDTPTALHIDVGSDNAFLSFLFTPLRARGNGWAKILIRMTCAALAAERLKHCVCHVQATNLRSRNTFEALGWDTAGWLLASAGGRQLGLLRNPFARLVALDVVAQRPQP